MSHRAMQELPTAGANSARYKAAAGWKFWLARTGLRGSYWVMTAASRVEDRRPHHATREIENAVGTADVMPRAEVRMIAR